ncbi:MAG: hypothetical protein HETSPECPRED_006850 [Heterodermia speciosa]|uniref:Uncharacterized protein n=1 Tax=Heterodermia speciosa TaxID=116794 RepID=A0A8H3FVE2_9LECA|nr:MAG: hypothetical protein HETSPECPRED_006850 [Heterodermia speciosa]
MASLQDLVSRSAGRLDAVSTQIRSTKRKMWPLVRRWDFSLGLAEAILIVASLGSCIAKPAHHVAVRALGQQGDNAVTMGRARANSLSAAGDSVKHLAPIDRRTNIPPPVRVVQFLRETINIAAADEHDAGNAQLWNICLEHVHWFIINPQVQVTQVENVAMKLERLYDLTMGVLWDMIETHNYPSEPEDNTFALRLGSVAIEWGCRADSLCWNLLYEFCFLMKQKAGQGWTGAYQGQLINAATGVVTWVKLTIRGRGPGHVAVLPKRGTGSMPPSSSNSMFIAHGGGNSRRSIEVYDT